MNDYSYQDMLRMQSEAKQRVLEMHKRSRDAADSFNGKRAEPEREEPRDLPRIPRAISYPAELQKPPRVKQGGGRQTSRGGFDIMGQLRNVFGELSDEDYERMFILSLCLLLTKDGADESLVIALMYLLT